MYHPYSAIAAMPNRGLKDVIDLTWDRHDRGGKWLVVERGHTWGRDGRDLYTTTGRLVATSVSLTGARNRAGKAKASLRRRGASGLIDIVRREDVAIHDRGAPYGCLSGNVTA